MLFNWGTVTMEWSHHRLLQFIHITFPSGKDIYKFLNLYCSGGYSEQYYLSATEVAVSLKIYISISKAC